MTPPPIPRGLPEILADILVLDETTGLPRLREAGEGEGEDERAETQS